jgi:RNA polymerase sigma factor (sigma-70 family)
VSLFPETSWTTIRSAGKRDEPALERFAERYREPVLAFIRGRGLRDPEADDVCQDVFLRLLKSEALAGADPSRGRFRSLLLAVAMHSIQDQARKARREPAPLETEPLDPGTLPAKDEAFDRAWILHLSERALARLREESPSYHAALKDSLEGRAHDRQKVWMARKKLVALIRDEVMRTCSSHQDFEQEVAYLTRFLGRGGSAPGPPDLKKS